MREKLIELLDKVHHTAMGETYPERIETIADYLIANGVTISDHKECTASLNYEKEYYKAMEEIQKAKYEIGYLRDELRNARNALSWHEAMKQTIEVIFGRKFGDG
jgi:hypothetical protein